jgi:hypothetical protein
MLTVGRCSGLCVSVAAAAAAWGKTMSRYHLMHCIPGPRLHGLNGYKEVIETIGWGLEQLGHQVTYAVNAIASDAANIIFGAHVLPIATLKQLPPNTIIYNFEQMRNVSADRIREETRYYARAQHFRLWDYSHANLPCWHDLGRDAVKIVPVGYAPILTRIPKAPQQDIDVLIYGTSGERRLQVFHALSQLGVSTLFVCGLYGPARDNLISRSKIVLNINLYPETRIFEIVRVSYLLANKKAVVADIDVNTSIDDDIRSVVKFAGSLKELIDICLKLLSNESERVELEKRGLSSISRRDIKAILENAL